MSSLFTSIIVPLLIIGACTHAVFAALWSILSAFTSLQKPTFRALGCGAVAVTIALFLEALIILPFVIADVNVSSDDIYWTIYGTCFLSALFSTAGACFAQRRTTA